MKKKTVAPKKLLVSQQTIRVLDRKEELIVAGGRYPYSWASTQDVCCF